MARLPLAIIPQSHRKPEPCVECTIGRQEAVESTARKRAKKKAAPDSDPEADPAPDAAAPAADTEE